MMSELGGRRLKQRVKTAKQRSLASTLWLDRQLNDPYVHEAKRQGYRSRAAFKIIQLDDKYHFFKPGKRVVDLGAAPGGWTQIAVDRVKGGRVVGLDILPIEPIAGADLIVVVEGGRILQTGTHAELMATDGRYKTMVEQQVKMALGTVVVSSE